MSFTYAGGGDSASRYNNWLAARTRQTKERQEAASAKLGPALLAAEGGSATAMRDVVVLVADRYGISITWREPDAAAYAYASGKSRVYIPPIRSATDFAVALHEIGHCLSEPCRGGDHQPDKGVTRWHHCIRCEVLAWDQAIRLATFSKDMHAELRRGLMSYRRSTPAPESAILALDRAAGTVAWATEQQKRKRWAWMLERQARAMGRSL